MNKISKKGAHLLKSSGLLLAAGVLAVQPAVLAGDAQSTGASAQAPLASTPLQSQPYDTDTLLITVNPTANKTEVADTLSELHANVTETIETSVGKVLVVKIEKGKLTEVQNKVSKDRSHFSGVQLNLHGRARVSGARQANDPYLPSQWQLGSIRATQVLNDFPVYTPRANDALLVIMDGGCAVGRSRDAGTKITTGYDATETTTKPGNIDQMSFPHGSIVFNASSAQANNRTFGAGLHNGQVFPIRVYTPANPGLTDVTLIRAFNRVEQLTKAGRRCVVNMSFGYDAPYDLNNEAVHPVVTGMMKKLYNAGKTLIFQAAENIPRRDPNPANAYLNVVAGCKQNETRADFSGFSPSVQFVAPAQGVVLFADGQVFATSGNSFSSPLVASVAARTWSERPGFTAAQIKNILVRSCRKLNLKPEEQGNGMPNARQAMKLATGK